MPSAARWSSVSSRSDRISSRPSSPGRSVDLTRREFELLTTLSESAGTVIERGEIYRRVWGYEMAHGDRSVDVFVRKLRSKIQRRSSGWNYIHTHFGIGYRFEAEPAIPEEAAGGVALDASSDEPPETPAEPVDAAIRG